LGAQFLTRDPLEAITRSAYGYAGNNPVNNTDPTGLYWGEGVLGGIGDLFTGSGCGAGGLFGDITGAFGGLVDMLPSAEGWADAFAFIGEYAGYGALAVGTLVLFTTPGGAVAVALTQYGLGLGLTSIFAGGLEAVVGGIGGDRASRQSHIRHGSLNAVTGMMSGFPYFDAAPKAAVAVGLYVDGLMMAFVK
jgi:hypothetical protein